MIDKRLNFVVILFFLVENIITAGYYCLCFERSIDIRFDDINFFP